MVLWQCKLRVSRHASRLSLLLHGIVLLLLTCGPAGSLILPLVLGTLTVLEGLRSQQRIRRRCGCLSWPPGRQLHWREQRWHLKPAPWLTPWLILLTLSNARGQRERLWLFADAMSPAEWRLLRQRLLTAGGED